MGSAKRMLIAVSIWLVVSMGAASLGVCQGTDESNWPVRTTFTTPVRIGSVVLSPGAYDLQLTAGTWARNVVAIYSVDQKRWVGMVMGVNDSRQDISKMSGFTFENMGKDMPMAVRYWFYPGWNRGIKFLYPGVESGRMAEAIAAARR